jgi:addiction module RelB/DinJ family antitoxin
MSIQVGARVDEVTKNTVSKVFEKYGLDMASGIRVFLKKVEQTNELPFTIGKEESDIDNGEYDPEFVKMVLESDKSYDPNSKSYTSAKESFDDILGKGWDK